MDIAKLFSKDNAILAWQRISSWVQSYVTYVMSGKVDSSSQSITNGTDHNGADDLTQGRLITIGTANGQQSVEVISHNIVTGTYSSGAYYTIPTWAGVATYVAQSINGRLTYLFYDNYSDLPSIGTNGTTYLVASFSSFTPPSGTNPRSIGLYEYNSYTGKYVATNDTTIQEEKQYYAKEQAYDEYQWIDSVGYNHIGPASVELGDYVKVKDLDTLLFAGSATPGGAANKTSAIPFGRVDSTSTSTKFTASVEGITALEDGVCVLLQNGVVASASGFTININNLGAHPCFNNLTAATRDTTIFAKDYTMLMIYDATRVVDGITGAWCCYRGYDANTNTIGYQLRTNSATLPAKFKTYRYRLYFTSADGTHWIGANASTSTDATSRRTPTSEKINPFGPIIYYSTNGTTNKDTVLTATTIWQQYTVTLGYSFNHTGAALVLEYPKPVYLKCTPQSDGSVKIAGSNTVASYVQELPTTEDGFVYIFLGIAYAATTMELRLEHPVYYFKGGEIRLWTNQAAADVSMTTNTYVTTIGVNGTSASVLNMAAVQGSSPSSISETSIAVPNWTAINEIKGNIPHNLHVTLTSSTSGNVTTYTANYTFNEIEAALNTGGYVDLYYDDYLYQYDGLVKANSSVSDQIYFYRVSSKTVGNSNSSDNVYEHYIYVERGNADGTWTTDEKDALIKTATTSRTGVVQLNDAVNSNSTTQAATANAVKKVKDAIPTKTSDLTNDSGFITSHQDISGKADKANQQIADEPAAEQHSSTYDATIATNIKIDTNSGSQSANVVQHDMVTGSITGTVNTDKTKIPTSAAVAKYVGDIAANKQDTISDLATIRSGASKGATAIQPTDIKDELDPGGNGEIPDSAAIAAYIEEKTPTKPTTSTDNAVARYDGTTGNLQNSGVTINDSNHVSAVKFISYGGTSNNFVKGDGSLDSSTYVKENAWLMPTNAFGGSSKAVQINLINNGFYAAHLRATVTLTGFTAGSAGQLFDGNYETCLTLPAGQTGVILIDSGSTPLFGSYSYGYTYFSFYYNNMPDSISMRVYGTRSSGGENWYDLGSATAFYASSGAYCYRIQNSGTYNCKKWEITIVAKSDTIAKPCQIDHQFSRGATAYMPVVTKFGMKQDLWGDVEAPKFIKRGGTSSQFLKADGSVDSTAYGTYSKPSGGIPKTDLASAVQTSLGKADTALQSHQDISGKVDYADGTKTTTTKQMGTTAVTIDGISMYTSESTTYTIQNGYTISIDAQGTSMGYIYKNSNSTILAQDPSGDVEWTNTTGESVVVKIGSATSGENYSIAIFKKGYYSTIEELTEKIEEAAASGVQADWDESDADDPAYIKNKPTVYTKPLSGIPKSDLSNAVQTSLGKADSAVQSVTVSQSAAVGTGGTTIQVDNGNIYKVVSDGEPQGSDNGYVAPTWGVMKTLLSEKVADVELRHGDTYDLPYDAQVEYLQSSGTQYIDTQFVPTITPKIVMDVAFVQDNLDKDLFGFTTNAQPSWIGNFRPYNGAIVSYYRYYATSSITGNFSYTVGDKITLECSNSIVVNGSVFRTTDEQSFASNQQSVLLFRARTNYHSVKIFYAKLYDGDVLKMDLIPVRVGQVGYMYDKISGQLFGNDGTGDFTFGNDVEEDLEQTDLYVDDEKVGTLITSYAPSASARPYVAPSWQSLDERLSTKSDKSNTYTKSEVNNIWSGINNNVIIGELPTTGQLQNRIYRVPGTNSYTDWAWDGSDWVKLAEFSGSIFMQITEAEYDALSDSEKNNGTWYFIEEE